MQEKLPNRVISFFLVLILGIYSAARAQAPDASFLGGCASISNGDLRGAVDNLNAAIARNNADERLFLYRGQALLGLRDYENAIRDFNEANEIVPVLPTYGLPGLTPGQATRIRPFPSLPNIWDRRSACRRTA